VSRHFDDLDAVLEFDALDNFWQLIFALQAPPCFRGGVDEFEHHELGGLGREAVFPLVEPPTPSTRYGVILLNSNARSHFALTNAIDVVGPSQLKALRRLLRNSANPWLVLLHHQVAEYPVTSIGLRERIGQRAGSIGGYRPALATCYRIAWSPP
jgi:hypothetical protein